jgi:hypothetical protein
LTTINVKFSAKRVNLVTEILSTHEALAGTKKQHITPSWQRRYRAQPSYDLLVRSGHERTGGHKLLQTADLKANAVRFSTN